MALTRLGPNQAINLASNTTGTLGVANGGTGLTSGTTDQFLKFTGSTTIASAADNAGKILQIKNLASTATTATSSGSYTATALDLSITPTSSSSKIIISMSTNTDNEAGGRQAEIGLWREIGGDGSTNTVIGGNSMVMASYGVSSRIVTGSSFVYIDSPATTSVVRYRVVIKSNTGNQVLFGAYMGSNSTIILQEATVA
tara:strand:+ start:25 stop:621 length:597 start_codon:yes stop_codon:yes gene_type:complete